MNKPLRILGMAGSLRRGSYNRAMLRPTVNQPEVMTAQATDQFDAQGQ